MIDEYWTWIFYGYHSDELKPRSNKPIVARCDECCQYRILSKDDYRDFCPSCSRKGERNHFFGKRHTEESKKKPPRTKKHTRKLADANRCKKRTDEVKLKMSESRKGKKHWGFGKHRSEDVKQKISIANTGNVPSDESRHKHSATLQGIPYEEWIAFSNRNEYCELFDEACRERIREKYDRKCFLCDTNEENNGQKLCVHHVDMNKLQGCNGVLWKLVPLCRKCHGRSHSKTWIARVEWLLENVWE